MKAWAGGGGRRSACRWRLAWQGKLGSWAAAAGQAHVSRSPAPAGPPFPPSLLPRTPRWRASPCTSRARRRTSRSCGCWARRAAGGQGRVTTTGGVFAGRRLERFTQFLQAARGARSGLPHAAALQCLHSTYPLRSSPALSSAPRPPAPQVPALAAHAYHKASGRRAAPPNQRLDYSENFLFMLDAGTNPAYRPSPQLARALVGRAGVRGGGRGEERSEGLRA